MFGIKFLIPGNKLAVACILDTYPAFYDGTEDNVLNTQEVLVDLSLV